MNQIRHFLSSLPLLFALASTHAAAPAGSISQLSGWVMTVKADGRVKALSAQSKLEVGDTLVSQPDSLVRLALDDGNEVVMGPSTTLKIDRFAAAETALSLVNGQLQVTGVPGAQPGRFTIVAGQTTIDAGAATFVVAYVPPPPGSAVALRQIYLRASLAALSSGVVTDAGAELPLREIVRELVAQGPIPQSRGFTPGLYVQVLDGLINVTNRGGAQNFSAGQFGFTPSMNQPPVIVPKNPGLQFTPPPMFNSPPPGQTSSASSNKSNTVDCEVR